MAPKPKSPTNADLAAQLDKIDKRLGRLENKSRNDDAYRAALKQVKMDEETDRQTKKKDDEEATKMKILKEVTKILGLITLALYAYLASKGIHT